jgi:tRNA-2-methylthio-N6-dimethylallyladenosine synthase
MGKRLYIETWGCQMNLHQSGGLAGVMTGAGYDLVDRLESADVILFNGCMVRQKAEEKVYGRIGAVVEEKRKRRVTLGVGGCLGQVRGESLLSRFPAIDFVFGSGGHRSIPDLVERVRVGSDRVVACGEPTTIDELPHVRSNPVRAMVTITEGCSNYCSYCIVPYARGPMRSRDPESIVCEVEDAIRSGALEVLLLGQNVNAYGTDRPEFGGFASLLARIAETGIPRVRFTTSHPRDMTDDVLDAIGSTANLCSHLHLPAQSGSDRILAGMNRGYTVARYLGIVDAARERIGWLNLTTDLIVGYPGETDADFEATMRLIEDVRFGSIFVAKYSPRPLTRSGRLEDDVPEPVKSERLERVLDRQRRIALEENERFVGQDVEVLFESAARDGGTVGRADDHRTVVARGGTIGELTSVRIEAAASAGLSGSVPVHHGIEGRR